jgi:ATP-dependent DNA helicase RecG
MMREASDVSTDSSIIPGMTWDDLDLDTFTQYRQHYQVLQRISPWNAYNNQRFLEAVGGYQRDREAGNAGITVAGLLLFGKQEAIRDWRSRHLIDFRSLLSDDDTDTRWNDRIVCEDNLYKAFFQIYPRLTQGLPIPFRLEGSTRIDESPVHLVLRESLVNLLIHADYAETGASLISRSPEQFMFRNPGNSRISEYDLFAGDRSDPRNPALVRMFRWVGLAEEAGTGIPKILAAWRKMGFTLPQIDVGTERHEFVLQLRMVHFISQQDREWLQSLGTHWNEAEQLALITARHENVVDNAKLRSLAGIHPADATKILVGLRAFRNDPKWAECLLSPIP